jgi:hypothetical protein
MKKEFKDIINIHRGKKALILGHGPSLNKITGHIMDFRKKGGITFGFNQWYHFYSTAPTYWVLANTVTTVKNQVNKMNEYKDTTTVLWAESVDSTDPEWARINLKCDFLSYDQRHFQGKPCAYNKKCVCNLRFKKGTVTLQQQLMNLSGMSYHYGSGDTVALHAVAFSVIMGCNPIYLTGIHLDYRKGYAKSKKNIPLNGKALKIFDGVKKRIIKDMGIIKEAADRRGIQIINLHQGNVFPDIQKAEIKW